MKDTSGINTPRTDTEQDRFNDGLDANPWVFARQLERELDLAESKLSMLLTVAQWTLIHYDEDPEICIERLDRAAREIQRSHARQMRNGGVSFVDGVATASALCLRADLSPDVTIPLKP